MRHAHARTVTEQVLQMRLPSPTAALACILCSALFATFGPGPAAAAPAPRLIRTLELDDYFDTDVEGLLPFPPGTGAGLALSKDTGVRDRLVPLGPAGAVETEAIELGDLINASLAARVRRASV